MQGNGITYMIKNNKIKREADLHHIVSVYMYILMEALLRATLLVLQNFVLRIN